MADRVYSEARPAQPNWSLTSRCWYLEALCDLPGGQRLVIELHSDHERVYLFDRPGWFGIRWREVYVDKPYPPEIQAYVDEARAAALAHLKQADEAKQAARLQEIREILQLAPSPRKGISRTGAPRGCPDTAISPAQE